MARMYVAVSKCNLHDNLLYIPYNSYTYKYGSAKHASACIMDLKNVL